MLSHVVAVQRGIDVDQLRNLAKSVTVGYNFKKQIQELFMTVSSESDVKKKLAALYITFKQQLPDRINEMVQLWDTFIQNRASKTTLADLHRMAHSLAGTGGTFGAIEVGTLSRELEKTLAPLLKDHNNVSLVSNEIQQEVNERLEQLRQTADKWQPSSISYIQPGKAKIRLKII